MLNAAALQILLELSAGQLGAVVRNDLVGIALPLPDGRDYTDHVVKVVTVGVRPTSTHLL